MKHAKTDYDATSLTASSPPRSTPRWQVCYVQSPSHDDEKNSTPASPPPSQGRHSPFSGSFKPNASNKHHHIAMKRFPNSWNDDKHFNSIEEEGLLFDDDESNKSLPRRCYVLAFVICFLVLLITVFALILYGASKPQKPKLTMRSITFERFVIQAGSDATGVATDMMSMKFVFRNTATFFGLHVTSTPLDLSFSQISIGSGTVSPWFTVSVFNVS